MGIVLPLLRILKIFYPQTKMNLKNHRLEVDHTDESDIFLNRHVFVSIFGLEIKEKSGRSTVKVSIVLPILLILKH